MLLTKLMNYGCGCYVAGGGALIQMAAAATKDVCPQFVIIATLNPSKGGILNTPSKLRYPPWFTTYSYSCPDQI